MKMPTIIKKYFKNKRELQVIENIIYTGIKIREEVEDLGRSRIFKATEYEKEECLNRCKKIQLEFIQLLLDMDKEINIDFKLIERINTLNIKTLLDCKELSNYTYNLGNEIKRKKKYNILIYPIFFNKVNLIEVAMILVLLPLLKPILAFLFKNILLK